MDSPTLLHWIYTACRMGRSGTAGYQTWSASDGITKEEQTELQHLTSFFASSSADAEHRRSFGFRKLTTSRRWALFSMTQGGMDDVGRPSFLSEAFLCEDLSHLPLPPWAYLRAECFRPALTREQACVTTLEPPLPRVPISDLEAKLAEAKHDAPIEWLKVFLQGKEEAACGMVARLLKTETPSPLLVAGETEDVLGLFALAWEVATLEQREKLSLCTLFSERNATTFSISGWPQALGNPGTTYFNRFSSVVQWSSPQDPHFLTEAAPEIANPLIDTLTRLLGPDTPVRLSRYGLNRLDERLKQFPILIGTKTINDRMVTDCLSEVQQLAASTALLRLAHEKQGQRLLTMVAIVAKTHAEALPTEALQNLLDLFGPNDCPHGIQQCLTLRLSKAIFAGPNLPDFQRTLKDLIPSTESSRMWLQFEQDLLKGLPQDACGWVLALQIRHARQFYQDSLPISFTDGLSASLRTNPDLLPATADLLLSLPERLRCSILKCISPANAPIILEHLAPALIQDSQAMHAWTAEPRWLGRCLGCLQASGQTQGDIPAWATLAPLMAQTDSHRRSEFVAGILEYLRPLDQGGQPSLPFTTAYELVAFSNTPPSLDLLSRIENDRYWLDRVCSGFHTLPKEPSPTHFPNLWSAWAMSSIQEGSVDPYRQAQLWNTCVDLIPRLCEKFQRGLIKNILELLIINPYMPVQAAHTNQLLKFLTPEDLLTALRHHLEHDRPLVEKALQRAEFRAHLSTEQLTALGFGPAQPTEIQETAFEPLSPQATAQPQESRTPQTPVSKSRDNLKKNNPVTKHSPPDASVRVGVSQSKSSSGQLADRGSKASFTFGKTPVTAEQPHQPAPESLLAPSVREEGRAAFPTLPPPAKEQPTETQEESPDGSSFQPNGESETPDTQGMSIMPAPLFPPQPKRTGYGALAAIIFIFILISAGVGYFLGSGRTVPPPPTAPENKIVKSTSTPAPTPALQPVIPKPIPKNVASTPTVPANPPVMPTPVLPTPASALKPDQRANIDLVRKSSEQAEQNLYQDARKTLDQITDAQLRTEELEKFATKAITYFDTDFQAAVVAENLDAAKARRDEFAKILPDKKEQTQKFDRQLNTAQIALEQRWSDFAKGLEPEFMAFRKLLTENKFTDAETAITALKEKLTAFPVSFCKRFDHLDAELSDIKASAKSMADNDAAAKAPQDARDLLKHSKADLNLVGRKLQEALSKNAKLADTDEFKQVEQVPKKKAAEEIVEEARKALGTEEKVGGGLAKAEALLQDAKQKWPDIVNQPAFTELGKDVAKKKTAKEASMAVDKAKGNELDQMQTAHNYIIDKIIHAKTSEDIAAIITMNRTFETKFAKPKGSNELMATHTTLVNIANAVVNDQRMEMLKQAKAAFAKMNDLQQNEARALFERVEGLVGTVLWKSPQNHHDYNQVIKPVLTSLKVSLMEVQELLKKKSFTDKVSDGDWGPGTQEAILKAQSAAGIKPPDGEISKKLLQELGWQGLKEDSAAEEPEPEKPAAKKTATTEKKK